MVSARGRGVALQNGMVKIPCLEGVPTVALELSLAPGSCPRLSNTDDDFIHIQLELQYRRNDGCIVKDVYNRHYSRHYEENRKEVDEVLAELSAFQEPFQKPN